MKIITWNCNMAFRKKAPLILKHKPDILIVPECEHPSRLIFSRRQKPTSQLWFGQNPHKGLGVFAYGGLNLSVLDTYNREFKMVVPIAVAGKAVELTLFAVWANNPADKDGQYVTQVWKALQHYGAAISNQATVLVGDFNSNTIWDRPKRNGNHSHVVRKLGTSSKCRGRRDMPLCISTGTRISRTTSIIVSPPAIFWIDCSRSGWDAISHGRGTVIMCP
jgi:exodeoxyribonuclease III